MVDPGFQLNCPQCREPLCYVMTLGDGPGAIHVYACSAHERFLLGTDGRFASGGELASRGPEGRR